MKKERIANWSSQGEKDEKYKFVANFDGGTFDLFHNLNDKFVNNTLNSIL